MASNTMYARVPWLLDEDLSKQCSSHLKNFWNTPMYIPSLQQEVVLADREGGFLLSFAPVHESLNYL